MTKKSRKAKDQQKKETAGILAAAGAGTLAATAAAQAGPDATLKAAQNGTTAPRTATRKSLVSASSEVATAMASLVAERGGVKWMKEVIDPKKDMTDEDVAKAIEAEREREEAFIDATRERLLRDIPQALKQPDPVAAVDQILEREQRYMEAHDDAAAIRVRAAASRAQVKRLSPQGAFWILSPHVEKHTPDCVAMAAVGWWPWEVLDELNPPVHTGCQCDLLTHDEAVGMGYMGNEIPDTTGAEKKAADIKKLTEASFDLAEAKDDRFSDMAMIALYPDPQLAVELSLPAGEDAQHLHMTLGYLGKVAELGSLDDAIDTVREWASACPELVGEISGWGKFVAGPEPVTYASVDLPDLPATREALVNGMSTTGSPIKTDHGFTPHITLDYGSRRPKIDKAIPVTFCEVHLVWGEETFVFPLKGESLEEAQHELMELQWNRRYAKGTIWGGRFMPKRGGFAPRISIKDIMRRALGNDAPDFVPRGGQRTISAPDPTDIGRGMNVPGDGKAKKAAKGAAKLEKYQQFAAENGSYEDTISRSAEDIRKVAKRHGASTAQVVWLPPDSDMKDGNGNLLAKESGGTRYETGDGGALIVIGQHEQESLLKAQAVRMSGGALSTHQAAEAYNARRTINHELTHNSSAISEAEYAARPDAFALEEALTEELAHRFTIEQAKAEGDLDLLRFVDGNPTHARVLGVYRPQRAGLLEVLEMGEVPIEDRGDLLERLSMEYTKTDDRIDELAKYVAKAQDIDHDRAVDITRGALFVHGTNETITVEGGERIRGRAGDVTSGGDGASILAPEVTGIDEPDLGWKTGDVAKVVNREEPYTGKVIAAQVTEDGRIALALEVPTFDADGKKNGTAYRYPDPDDVEKAGNAPKKRLETVKATGNVREGDRVRVRRNDGEIVLASLEKVIANNENSFTADLRLPNGQKKRINDMQIQDIRKAGKDSRASKPKVKKKVEPIPGGGRRRKPKPVDGPRGFDPRRYEDPRRGLLSKIHALPPGEELELADGSRITRGKKHGSALIERPDGSRRRYASPARLANAETLGIEKRTGPRAGLTDPKDGDPDDHKSLAHQSLKDAALDNFSGMASPGDPDDPKYWDDLGNILTDWVEDPRLAMERATEEQKHALMAAVDVGSPGVGPFFRGQAVEHAEPIHSGRVRGWSAELQVAIDFAKGGPEVRKADGKRFRAGGVDEDGSGLDPGDALLISIYKAEDASKGIDVTKTLDEAEERSYEQAQDDVEALWDKKADAAMPDLTRRYAIDTILPSLDGQELQVADQLIGSDPPANFADEVKDIASGNRRERLSTAFDNMDAGELETFMGKLDDATGTNWTANWDMQKGVHEGRIKEDAELEVYSMRTGFANPYSEEREVILDNEHLDGYKRIDVVIAKGGQDNDLSDAAIRAKVEDAIENGGYKPPSNISEDQMSFDDLEDAVNREDVEVALAAGGMASPDGVKKWMNTDVMKGLSKKEKREEIRKQKAERKRMKKQREIGFGFAEYHDPSMMSLAWQQASARMRQDNTGQDNMDGVMLAGLFGMASPGDSSGSSKKPPSLFDYFKWNKSQGEKKPDKPPRTEPEIQRSMLENPPEPIQGIPDYSATELEDVKAAGGSNGARIAVDQDGNEWLLKTYKGDRDRVATELLANSIYRELGVSVSNAGTAISEHPQHGPTLALGYPLVDGEIKQWKEPNAELGEGFVADALLANWDVIGLTQDNILWNNGHPIRLDQGGTLEFRAMGARKEFGPVPTELWTMKQGRGQANGTMEITDSMMQAGAADAAIRLTPERIDQLVDEAPFSDDEMRERVRETLKQRVDWLDKFSRGEVGPPEPLEQEEASAYFEKRDKGFETLPSEDVALENFYGTLREAVDEHLHSKKGKDEASRSVAETIKDLDVLLNLPNTKLDEDIIAWVPAPDTGDLTKLDKKWFTERSYLELMLDQPEGTAIKVTIPAGTNAVMPSHLAADIDPGGILLGRNSKLQVRAVSKPDGSVVLTAVVRP